MNKFIDIPAEELEYLLKCAKVTETLRKNQRKYEQKRRNNS